MLIRAIHMRIRFRWLRFKMWIRHKRGKDLDIKIANGSWYKWERTPSIPIIYLDEDKWWNEFVPWVMMTFYEPMANKTIRQKIGRWFFKQKVMHFLRGWTGWDAADNQTIWIRETKYNPITLLHEIGHTIHIPHYWTPGIMNPIWFFRWF